MAAANSRSPSDRTAFGAWLVLLVLAVVAMFGGTLLIFSILPGVDASALYAPITDNVWGIVGAFVGILALAVGIWGIAPAIRAHFHPTAIAARAATRAHHDQYLVLKAERDTATKRARTAEGSLAEADAVNASLCSAINEAYATLYGTSAGTPPTHLQKLQSLRIDLMITRQKADTLEEITTERNDLRTRVTELLNTPAPTVPWTTILPWVAYGHATPKLGVKKLRDEFRARGITIADREAEAFSAAVRALPAYSPAPKVGSPATPSGVKPALVTPSAPTHGHTDTPTDGRARSRTRRTARTRTLPTARTKVEVQA